MARINDIAIDIGTTNILIYELGHGLVGRVPAVVAVKTDNETVWKYGEDARNMVGRTPLSIQTIYPLRSGKIRDYSLFSDMLQHAIYDTFKDRRRSLSRPRAVVALPSLITDIELSRVHSTLFDAGLGHTEIVDRSIAAAIGCHVPMDDPTGFMIVDMGGSVTDISVISAGRVVEHNCINVSGDSFNDAIMRYIRQRYSLQIGQFTAETLKINNTSALKSSNKLDITVAGRLATTNLPKQITISNYDLTDAIHEPLQQLIDEIHNTLCHTDSTLVSDICQYGIVLSGGPSGMSALSDAIGIALNIPTMQAERGDETIVTGCSYILQNIRAYKRYLNN